MIHGVDVGIFHLMARLKLHKGRREGKSALPGAIMGAVLAFRPPRKIRPPGRERARRVVRNGAPTSPV